MSYDYETIKAIAKQLGVKVTDLLALAPQNDPFYVGTAGDIEMARWFADIWERTGYETGVHLRRIHYWTVSQSPAVLMPNGLPYENTDKCWQYLVLTSKKARYLGLVQIENIADNKNPKPHVSALYDFRGARYEIDKPELAKPYVWVYGMEEANAQPYHLELWCEKSTMNDVLIPICREYGVNLVTFEGEVSITACYDLIKRIQAAGGKPTRVWYISDFDPAGNSMPVAMSRKVEYMLNHFQCDFDVRIKPIALTAEQVASYDLPRIPIKETEKRAAKFEDAFGTGAVELDALEALYPGALARIVTSALRNYYSDDAAAWSRQQNAALRQAISEQVEAITARYQAEIEAVREMIEQVASVKVDTSKFKSKIYAPHVEEIDDWLFDSGREYTAQIGFYKAHKGQSSE